MTTRQTIWTPRNTYLYLVCLVTLIMVIIATVNFVRAGVELLYPEPELLLEEPVRVPGEPPAPDAERTEEQIRYQQRWAQRRSVLSLVTNGTLLPLAGPLYVMHWRR
ncbi:MAG TPA: hypothetical protein GX702_11975, partial [Chloroflexi bacterium]|nr:hypothetical protein [Chloroflexota bacterium]